MTNPRQLAPTVGLVHSDVEFFEKSLSVIEKFIKFQLKQEPEQKNLHQA